MKKQTIAFGTLVCIPMIFCHGALAADKASNAYLVGTQGSPVRNSSGDCVRTSAYAPAAAGECNGVASAAPVVPPPVAATPPPPAEQPVAETVSTTPIPPPPPAVIPEAPVAVVVPAPTPPQSVSVTGGALFEFDRADLKPSAQQQLSELASKIKGQSEVEVVVITGHADAIGPDSYNQQLSKQRAQSVRDFLLNQGVVSKNIVIQALGEEKPVASNDSEDGRAQNRRVEISVKASTGPNN